jgi:RNA polymerase sigma-70 factor (ECF subfamily)
MGTMEEGQTSYNRAVYAAPLKRLGFRKYAVGLAPFVRIFSSTFCGCWSLLRKALIRNRKMSYTAGTLYEMGAKSLENKKHNMNYLSDKEIMEYGKLVSILSNRMISDKEVARDAAQEVWIEILNSLPSFKNDSKLSTWIYTIAKRVIYKYAIKERHYSFQSLHDYLDGDDKELPKNIDNFENEFWIKNECDRCLTGLFHCLTNDDRIIYLFRDVIHLNYTEIARIMDKNEQYIRKIISRARSKLKHFLNDECMIYNPNAKCKCRMKTLLKNINLPQEYQRIRDLGKHISILAQADKILPAKNYWEKYMNIQ